MKKALIVLAKVFLIVTLLFVGLYFGYKNITKNNLEDKLQTLNDNWTELLKLQDEKNNFLEILVNNSSSNIQYIDSLNINLAEYTKNRRSVIECNPSFVYEQYLSNKYTLPLIKFYSKNEQLVDNEKKNTLMNVANNIEKINKVIEKYNSSVRDYNLYYSSFPNFIIAKSYGFKRKDYFEIQYGIENIDPKIVKKERREWQRKIEIEHGLSE
ncbi:LemA family protein [Flavobacterium magnesitis]|uniref:LemA family protein n=1 Tax=Flavobacterium magnesitis TaxID=3138077 RepID=UPI00358E9197